MTDYGTIDGGAVNLKTVRFERIFSGPIERVWDFLIKPEHLAACSPTAPRSSLVPADS